MNESDADFYLTNLGVLLKETALSARQRAGDATDPADKAFEQGRAMAYYEVISLMKQQAEAFGIDAARISLADIEPDRDLL